MIRNFNDETNFPHKMLFTDIQVSKIPQAFAKRLSANIKFFKTHLPKMQSGLGVLPEIKTGIFSIDNFINFPFKMAN